MDFFNLLRSAEELLFELTMWIVLYPRTLWRSLCHPEALARKVNTELGQEGSRRFDDMVSPPICLLLSVALGSALSPGANASTDTNALGDWIAQSFYNNLVFSAVAAATLPLMFCWLLLRRQQRPFNRDNVRRPFYLQAYLISPLAVAMEPALGLAAYVDHAPLQWFGGAVAVAVLAIYIVNATRVAMHELGCGPVRALLLTLQAMGLSLLILTACALALMDYSTLAQAVDAGSAS